MKTPLSVQYPPNVIACASIFLTSRVCQIPLPKSPPWYTVFDAKKDDLLVISAALVNLYKVDRINRRLPLTTEDVIKYTHGFTELFKDDPDVCIFYVFPVSARLTDIN